MPFHITATRSGPPAEIARSLGLPAAPGATASALLHLWELLDPDAPPGHQRAFALLHAAGAALQRPAFPKFDACSDWTPGLTVLFERQLNIRAAASAEVSALWTSIAAPTPATIAGDVGLDLDLGLRAAASWHARSHCWWAIERPSAAPVLRVRLFAGRESRAAVSVQANAVSGLDAATRRALAAVTGRLHDAAEPLAGLSSHAEALTARLEHAALRTLEKSLEFSLGAAFSCHRSQQALLDATFDFAANPALEDTLFRSVLDGDFHAALDRPLPGLILHGGALTSELTRRRTFHWRLPFTAGARSHEQRLSTAIEALDGESGRIVKLSAKAASARRTRQAASLLALEGAFAQCLPGSSVAVHHPAAAALQFVLEMRPSHPRALQPLFDLYGAGPVPAGPAGFRLEVQAPPESLAHWLLPQDPASLSRRMQAAWRELLLASVPLDSLTPQSAAPLLVWASIPVSTAARRTRAGVGLNRPGSVFWDWRDPALRRDMIWNPRTRASLESRLAAAPWQATPDELRRAAESTLGDTVLASLLYAEAAFIDRLTSTLARLPRLAGQPATALREFGLLLAALAEIFHQRLSSVYSPDAARALGPLLLTAASPLRPTARLTPL
jgi:hypothetical protein